MYLRLSRLRRFTGGTSDGELGSIDTLYFDPEDWAVRFLAMNFGPQHEGLSSALVSPLQIRDLRVTDEEMELDPRHPIYRLVKGDRHRPLSPELTGAVVEHYELPRFWDGSGVWGEHSSPRELTNAASASGTDMRNDTGGGVRTEERVEAPPTVFPHHSLMGRGVFSPDSRLGVISDLLVDVEAWRIRYFIVWLQAPGESGEVLLSPFWVNGPPEKSRVTVPMTTEAIVSGPNFAPEELQPLDERILARYFGFLTEQ
jgi:hypothetical protein